MSTTLQQRREKEKIDAITRDEHATRGVVEAEHGVEQWKQRLVSARAEQAASRAALLALVAPRRKRPDAPESVLEAARAVEAGAKSPAEVAAALGCSAKAARNRLVRAERANLIDRVGRGVYVVAGVVEAPQS